MVSLSDLRRNGKFSQANQNFANNIPLQIEKYQEDEKTKQLFAVGINLHTGEEMSISLANQQQFIKFFTNPTKDISIRTQDAEKFIAKRNTMAEFKRTTGNKSIPTEGVISFTNVRKDPETGNYIARWANGINRDPSIDKTLTGYFNVKSKLITINNQQVPTTTISFIDNKSSINPYQSENIKQAIDQLLSGQTPGISSPVRTSVFISMQFSDGNKGLFLPASPKLIGIDENQNKFINPTHSGLEASLNNRKLDQYTQTGAVVLAALYGISFNDLKLDSRNTSEQIEMHKAIYDMVKSKEIPIALSQSVFFTPTRHLNDSFLNQAPDNASNKNDKNSNFVDRGWFDGYGTARFKSPDNLDAVFEPKLIQIESSRFLPQKTSDNFMRLSSDFVADTIINSQPQNNQPTPKQEHHNQHDNNGDYDDVIDLDDTSYSP